jgi:endogenous inhibitor of DNA gyrase (YacG/DUF329 family)
VSAEQRDCPQCGSPFTWTPAAPRQKYCSARCKHRWHRAHGKPRKRHRSRQPATRDVAGPPTATTHVALPSPPAAGTATEAALAAEPACPHCRKPVALVAWLVPPAAATVKEPPRHADLGQ